MDRRPVPTQWSVLLRSEALVGGNRSVGKNEPSPVAVPDHYLIGIEEVLCSYRVPEFAANAAYCRSALTPAVVGVGHSLEVRRVGFFFISNDVKSDQACGMRRFFEKVAETGVRGRSANSEEW
jgi:hypothetical protein